MKKYLEERIGLLNRDIESTAVRLHQLHGQLMEAKEGLAHAHKLELESLNSVTEVADEDVECLDCNAEMACNS